MIMANFRVIELKLTENNLLCFNALDDIAHHLANRGLVVLPTETGYLLGANALDVEAVKKVFEVKGRQSYNPIHAVVSGMDMVDDLVFLDPVSRRVCSEFFPGPLTVICPKKPVVSDFLVANTGNLGVRVPDCPATIQVVQAFGKPITATSLNLSGESSERRVEDTIASLNWQDEALVYLVKEKNLIKHSLPSTLVTFCTEPWSILREGPIGRSELSQVIDKNTSATYSGQCGENT